MRATAMLAILAAGCSHTAVVAIENGRAEVAEFEVRRPARQSGRVVLKFVRETREFREWLRVSLPSWKDGEATLARPEVTAEYQRDWEDGRLETATELGDARVHVRRHSGPAGASYSFEVAVLFSKVVDPAGTDLGKRRFDVNFDAPIKEK